MCVWTKMHLDLRIRRSRWRIFRAQNVGPTRPAYERGASLASKGMSVICPTLEEQDCFLRKLGLPAEFIPYDSDNRRNIGYLIALEGDCDFVISIDDDNFARA